MIIKLLTSTLLLLTIVLCGLHKQNAHALQTNTQPISFIKQNGKSFIQGEALVKFKKNITYSHKIKTIKSKRSHKVKEFAATGFFHIKSLENETTEEIIKRVSADPTVDSVQPNYIYHATALPSDPGFAQQWSLQNNGQHISNSSYKNPDGTEINNPGITGYDVNIVPAWDYTSGCDPVTIAILDTGVKYDHVDLINSLWGSASHGRNTIDDNDYPMDDNGHGTMVAGIIGAKNNNGGSVGVFWKSQIMAVKVLDSTGTGSSASIIEGINYAVANGAKIITLCASGNSFDQSLYDAINNARSSGVLVVTGAGNDGVNIDNPGTIQNPEYNSYPAEYALDNIISVAAIDQNFELASFSNYGLGTVSIAAPGVNIYNTWAGVSSILEEDFMSENPLDGPDWNGSEQNTTYPSSNWGVNYTIDPNFPTIRHYYLANPFYAGIYRNDSQDRVWKDFNTIGKTADVSTISYSISHSFADANDSFSFYFNNSDGYNPTALNSILMNRITGGSGTSIIAKDVSYLAKDAPYFSIMFQFSSDSSGNNSTGVKRIKDLKISTLNFNTTSYTVKNGTSLAAPHVAGTAAMLFGYNPEYSYLDVIRIIKAGSKNISPLSAKIQSGRVLDATKAFEHIDTPQQLKAEAL